jgi:signal peptidase II
MKSKLTTLSITFVVILVLDIVTKRWALSTLGDGRSIDLLDGLVPLTLAFNRGAAFGIEIGSDPRYFFIPITIVALVLLGVLLVQAERGDWLRIFSVSLVISGAVGNLVDRVRWNRGVVDFIGPVDLGFMDWPIFNVADMAISCGAVMLALSFWLEERQAKNEASQEVEAPLADSSPS